MLVRLLYVSQPVGPITTTTTTLILEKSTAYNKKENITGVLCQGSGLFLQVLEGERSHVNLLYARIMALDGRNYAQTLWSMVYGACLFVQRRPYGSDGSSRV
jgi:hypothetical protein